MMKRSTNGTVGHDIPDVPISKIPPDTKVVWLVDPAVLVGPREEEARRKAPEGKLLYAVSAVLTIMVLWGIFRQVHYMVPQMFSSGSGDAAAVALDHSAAIDSDASVFQAVDDSGIGGRRAARNLMETHAEQFLIKESPRRRVHGIHKHLDQQQQEEERRESTRVKGTVHHRREVSVQI